MKRYWIYVRRTVTDSDFLGMWLSGEYDLSFFLEFPEYRIPGIIAVSDGENLVPDCRISARNEDWKTIRPFIADCEDWITDEYASQAVSSIPPQFEARLFDNDGFADWIRSNTDLEEVEEWKFLISDETTDTFGNPVPAKYLVIA